MARPSLDVVKSPIRFAMINANKSQKHFLRKHLTLTKSEFFAEPWPIPAMASKRCDNNASLINHIQGNANNGSKEQLHLQSCSPDHEGSFVRLASHVDLDVPRDCQGPSVSLQKLARPGGKVRKKERFLKGEKQLGKEDINSILSKKLTEHIYTRKKL